MNAKRGLAILVAILLLLLMWLGYWAYSINGDKTRLTAEKEILSTELSELNDLKNDLKSEVDSLQTAYENLAEENENLQGSLADAREKVVSKDNSIRKLKRQSAQEASNLKAQIEQLLATKSTLETRIYGLQTENDSLRNAMGQLSADLVSARSENQALATLNATIQDELKKLTLANFKASAFRVEVEKRKPRATAKSRRAKRILVSFDLTNVVAKYQGVRPLYLVVTDDKGTPVKMANPIQATVIVNGQEMDIQAVKTQEINIEENQRLSFNYDLEERLKSGYYRVAVYTDIGLLGASSFRLR